MLQTRPLPPRAAPGWLARPAGVLRGPLAASGLVLVVGLVLMSLFAADYTGSVIIVAFTYGIVTAGMAVQIGFSQQIAFSQSVFMGVGAYGVALLDNDAGVTPLLGALIVTIGAGLVAYVLGSVVTRVSGLALAVATLMLPLIGVGVVSSANFLGGEVGLSLTGSLWNSSSPQGTVVGDGIVTVVILAIVVLVCGRLLASDLGLELFVLGVDERTAASMGVSTPRRKLELFVLGSMTAALGGAVYAGTQAFVPATIVNPTAELSLLMMLFIGGRRSILGAVAGAVVIQYLQGASNWVSVNILVVQGVLITAVLLVDNEGLAGIVRKLAGYLTRQFGGPAGTGAAPAGAAGPAPAEPVLAGPAPADSALLEPALAGPALAEPTAAGRFLAAQFATSWGERTGGTGDAARPLLECKGISKDFGGLQVLQQLELTLPARGLFGLCGPNGAGKSTLLGIIGGSITASAGTITLDGADVTKLPPQERFHLGVGRTFQAVHLIQGRSVLDNVAVSCLSSYRSGIAAGIGLSRLGRAREQAMAALEYLNMGALASQEVSGLTLENQRMVEFARAIAARPRLLLLDEPTSGLSEPQRDRLQDVLRTVAGMTCVLLVEHDLSLVAAISQKIYVLASGGLAFVGGPEEFRASDVVNSLLVGL